MFVIFFVFVINGGQFFVILCVCVINGGQYILLFLCVCDKWGTVFLLFFTNKISKQDYIFGMPTEIFIVIA